MAISSETSGNHFSTITPVGTATEESNSVDNTSPANQASGGTSATSTTGETTVLSNYNAPPEPLPFNSPTTVGASTATPASGQTYEDEMRIDLELSHTSHTLNVYNQPRMYYPPLYSQYYSTQSPYHPQPLSYHPTPINPTPYPYQPTYTLDPHNPTHVSTYNTHSPGIDNSFMATQNTSYPIQDPYGMAPPTYNPYTVHHHYHPHYTQPTPSHTPQLYNHYYTEVNQEESTNRNQHNTPNNIDTSTISPYTSYTQYGANTNSYEPAYPNSKTGGSDSSNYSYPATHQPENTQKNIQPNYPNQYYTQQHPMNTLYPHNVPPSTPHSMSYTPLNSHYTVSPNYPIYYPQSYLNAPYFYHPLSAYASPYNSDYFYGNYPNNMHYPHTQTPGTNTNESTDPTLLTQQPNYNVTTQSSTSFSTPSAFYESDNTNTADVSTTPIFVGTASDHTTLPSSPSDESSLHIEKQFEKSEEPPQTSTGTSVSDTSTTNNSSTSNTAPLLVTPTNLIGDSSKYSTRDSSHISSSLSPSILQNNDEKQTPQLNKTSSTNSLVSTHTLERKISNSDLQNKPTRHTHKPNHSNRTNLRYNNENDVNTATTTHTNVRTHRTNENYTTSPKLYQPPHKAADYEVYTEFNQHKNTNTLIHNYSDNRTWNRNQSRRNEGNNNNTMANNTNNRGSPSSNDNDTHNKTRFDKYNNIHTKKVGNNKSNNHPNYINNNYKRSDWPTLNENKERSIIGHFSNNSINEHTENEYTQKSNNHNNNNYTHRFYNTSQGTRKIRTNGSKPGPYTPDGSKNLINRNFEKDHKQQNSYGYMAQKRTETDRNKQTPTTN